jgi:flagellar L-ring protein precursor FlgH
MKIAISIRHFSFQALWILLISLIISLLWIATCAPARADSLLKESEGLCDIFSSRTAVKQGDIITIVFKESTTATQAAKGKLQNTYKFGADQGQGFLEKFIGLGLGGGETNNIEISTTQTHALSSTMSATVKEVLPNGYLKVEGERILLVNHEKQRLVVTGLIRPNDVTFQNTIDSTKVADLCAHVEGLPIEGSLKKKRGGIIRWIYNLLF